MNFQIKDSDFGAEGYKPLVAVRYLVKFPLPIAAAVLVLFVIIAGGLQWNYLMTVGLSGYVGVDQRISTFRVNNLVTEQFDGYSTAPAYTSGLRDLASNSSFNSSFINPHITNRYQTLGSLQFYYQSKTGNVFTPAALADIRNIETKFIQSAGYLSRCQLQWKDYRTVPQGLLPLTVNQSQLACLGPKSAMNLFYPTLNASEPRHYLLYDIYDFNGNGTSLYPISDITNFMATSTEYSWFVSQNFTLWNQTSNVMRTEWTFGAPVPPHTSLSDLSEQMKEFTDWIKPFSKLFQEWSTNNVRLLWQGTAITDYEISEIIKRDTLFALGSVFLVLLWMTLHFKSVVLALVGMLNILASIPVGHFVTHIIMGNKHLGLLMTLPIFVILGIGCDDLFIFFDAWQASGRQGAHISANFEHRIDWAYRRAMSSMLVTSLTASATFFLAATSPVMPIRLFGISVGTTILANLFLVLTFFPAVLVLYHQYLENRFTWGNAITSFTELWWKPDDEEAHQSVDPEATQNPTSIIVNMKAVQIVQDVRDGEDLPPQPLPELELEKFPYFSKKRKYAGKSRVHSVSGSTSSDSVPSTTRVSTDDSSDDEKTIKLVRETEGGIKVVIELDEEPLSDPWNLNASGRCCYFNFVPFVHVIRWVVLITAIVVLVVCFAASFYLTPQPGQPQFFPVGSNLNDFTALTYSSFGLNVDSYGDIALVWGIKGVNTSSVNLYDPDAVGVPVWDTTFDLSDPLAQDSLSDTFDAAATATFKNGGTTKPLCQPGANFHISFITAFKQYRIAHNQTFPVEDATEFWTSLKSWLASDGQPFNEYLGWSNDANSAQQKLIWCSIGIRGSVALQTTSLSEMISYTNAWASFMQTRSANAPFTAKGGFATSLDFVWTQDNSALERQATLGTLGAIGIGFVVMLVISLNLVISIIATLCIIWTVMMIIGFYTFVGWSLGLMDFVSLTIVVGLSIGYNVHTCMAYLTYARHSMLKDKPRVAIIQYAMAEIGSPLISGAITTAISVIMLFFCDITLFSHFGKFMFVNTIATVLVTFFLLLTFLLLLGPRADFGSLDGILAWWKERQRMKKERSRLKARQEAAKLDPNDAFAEHYIHSPDDEASRNTNTTNSTSSKSVEMSHLHTPNRSSSHGLQFVQSPSIGSTFSSPSNLKGSASMSDFELNLDDDTNESHDFDLDQSVDEAMSVPSTPMKFDENRSLPLQNDDDEEPIPLDDPQSPTNLNRHQSPTSGDAQVTTDAPRLNLQF